MKSRVYVQSEFLSDVRLVEVEDGASIAVLKEVALAILPAEAPVAEMHLFVEDEDDEVAEPSKHDIKQLKKPHGIHVHLHRCQHIAVTVRFSGKTASHQFRPSATIGRIREWAAHKLGMQPGDAAEHVLQLAGTNTQPEVNVHVGTLVKCPTCSVEFDLVPSHRING